MIASHVTERLCGQPRVESPYGNDTMLQREHWSEEERSIIVQGLLEHNLFEIMKPQDVPQCVLDQLPKRSAEGIRQYLARHGAQALDDALGCNDVLCEMSAEASKLLEKKVRKPPTERKPPSLPSHKRPRQDTAETKASSAPVVQAVPPPPPVFGPRVVAMPRPPPMVLPPRAITFGAKKIVLNSHSFATLLERKPACTFADINERLRDKMRDARTENYDGLPMFMPHM
jgi:hypothetical protein